MESPRFGCDVKASFETRILTEVGTFARSGRSVTFSRAAEIPELSSEPPLVCIALIGQKGAEYFVGKTDTTLELATRERFFSALLSVPVGRVPSRLQFPLSYRRRLNDWRFSASVVGFYELDNVIEDLYQRLVNGGFALSMSPGKYFDVAEQYLATLDLRKRNAGASGLIDRLSLQVSNSHPFKNRLNFKPLAFHESTRSLYFMPDGVVLVDLNGYQHFQYSDIGVELLTGGQFVTLDVPRGVSPIGYTWQYVNRDGTPDRRFNNNVQLPIIAVSELDFVFPNGAQVHTAFTQESSVVEFVQYLAALGANVY